MSISNLFIKRWQIIIRNQLNKQRQNQSQLALINQLTNYINSLFCFDLIKHQTNQSLYIQIFQRKMIDKNSQEMMRKFQLPNIQVILLGNQYQAQATYLLNENFCNQNPIWKCYVRDQSQTLPYLNQIVKKCIFSKLLYGVIEKQTKTLITAITFLDMVDYLQFLKSIQGKYQNVELIKLLGVYGAQLQKQMRSQQYQRGKTIYGLVGATKKQYGKAYYGALVMTIAFYDFISRGFKTYYGRCSNPISTLGSMRLGCQIINQVTIENTDLSFYLSKIQLKQFQNNFKKQHLSMVWQHSKFRPKL